MAHEQAENQEHRGLRLRARLRYLYHGGQPQAVKFRLMVIIIDIAIIGFFLAAPILKEAGWAFYVLDYLIAAWRRRARADGPDPCRASPP